MQKRSLLIGLNLILLAIQYIIFIDDWRQATLKTALMILAGVIAGIGVIWLVRYINHLFKTNYYLLKLKEYQELFRMISLVSSSLINAGYVGLELWLGIKSQSIWFILLASYYLALFLSRFYLTFLLFYDKRHQQSNKLSYQKLSYLMLLLIPAFIGLIFVTLYSKKIQTLTEVETITIATFTFYNVIVALKNFITNRKSQAYLLKADTYLSFSVSLISLYSLQTTMLLTFWKSQAFYDQMTIYTGIGILSLLIMTNFSLVRSSYRL